MQDQFTSAATSELTARILSAAKAYLRTRPIEALVPWELTLLYMPVPGSDEVFLAPHTKDAFWLQRRALALDPRYAPAHASLASALAYHALFNPAENTKAALEEAEKHAQIASAEAPFDPEMLYQIATYYRYRGMREKSADILRRILEIHPDDIQARIDLPFVQGQCSAQGDRAVAQLLAIDRQLLPANPVRRILLSHLADIHLSQGRFEQARDAAAQSRDIVKATWSGITLAAALAQLGQSAEALRVSAETKLEWPTLDYDQFADKVVPTWCLGGPATGPARAGFHRLAELERGKR
jgi:tetratricopeptide (TPR) repeat protein